MSQTQYYEMRMIQYLLERLAAQISWSYKHENQSLQLCGTREEFEALLRAGRIGLGELARVEPNNWHSWSNR